MAVAAVVAWRVEGVRLANLDSSGTSSARRSDSSRRVASTPAVRTKYLIVGGGNAAGYLLHELALRLEASGAVNGSLKDVTVATAEFSKESGQWTQICPYERPALTKAFLHPPSAKVRARLPGFHTPAGIGEAPHDEAWHRARGVRWLVGRATSVDAEKRTVLVSGRAVRYGKLVLATGASARYFESETRLPAAEGGRYVRTPAPEGVHYIRSLAQARWLMEDLEAKPPAGRHAVVVGGGYVGVESASAIVGWGVNTTLVVRKGLLGRYLNSELSSWLEQQLSDRGINILKEGGTIDELVGGGTLTAVKFKGGAELKCDLAVLGLGAVPNIDFLQGSGLTMTAGGVAVDGFMRTSSPDVFAVGDIAAFPHHRSGPNAGNYKSPYLTRFEQVDHARKSAAQAAAAVLGQAVEPYRYTPYTYTRLFEYTERPIVLNFFGETSGDVRVLRKSDNSAVAAIWEWDGRAVGVLMMGSPGPSKDDAAQLRKLAESPPPTETALAFFAKSGLA